MGTFSFYIEESTFVLQFCAPSPQKHEREEDRGQAFSLECQEWDTYHWTANHRPSKQPAPTNQRLKRINRFNQRIITNRSQVAPKAAGQCPPPDVLSEKGVDF